MDHGKDVIVAAAVDEPDPDQLEECHPCVVCGQSHEDSMRSDVMLKRCLHCHWMWEGRHGEGALDEKAR